MSKIPEFHFDFDAVEGQPFEEAAVNLFKQLEGHYNQHIKPAPIIFGGKKIAPPFKQFPDGSTGLEIPIGNTPVKEATLIRVEPGYEIKDGSELGLKAGAVLTGVRADTKVEIFDFLKNYTPGDQIVEGDSGKYDLGRK